jgi:hypothetical protein
VTGPPDYVGVGTVAAGSLWWHGLLLEHPQVEPRPEDRRAVHFFEGFCTRAMTEEDIARYHAQFPRREGRIAGEWTQRYAFDPWTALPLRRAAPAAKLLMLVSDPIERYRVKLASVRREGDEDEYAMSDMAARGRYATQLRNLLAHFPREQVLVLQSERCTADPLPQYRRMLAFLGLDEDVVPPGLARRASLRGRIAARVRPRPAQERADLWPDLERALRADLEPEVRELAELVPDLDLSLWPHFGP